MAREKDPDYHRKYYQRTKQRRLALRQALKREKRRLVRRLKREHGCSRCGIDDPDVLQFHHKRPATKKAVICVLVNGPCSLQRLQEEIALCTILCANCHLKLEANKRRKLNGSTLYNRKK